MLAGAERGVELRCAIGLPRSSQACLIGLISGVIEGRFIQQIFTSFRKSSTMRNLQCFTLLSTNISTAHQNNFPQASMTSSLTLDFQSCVLMCSHCIQQECPVVVKLKTSVLDTRRMKVCFFSDEITQIDSRPIFFWSERGAHYHSSYVKLTDLVQRNACPGRHSIRK